MRSASAVVCALAVVAATVGCGAHGARPRERGSSSRPVVVRAAPPLQSVGARVQARIPTGVTAVCSIVAAGGRVWVSAPEEGQVIAIDPHTDRVVARKRLPGKACLMRSAGGLLWVDLREGLVVALDPAGGRVRRYVRTEHTCGYGFDFAGGALWVADGLPLNALTRRDPRTGATLATTPTIGGPQSGPCAVTAAAGSIWVGTSFGVYRVDPRHVRVAARIDAGEDTQSTLVAAGDRLWVGDDVADGLRELDARSGRTLAIYRFGGGSVAIGAGRVWATGGRWASTPAGRIPTLVEIDPRIERVVGRYRVGRRDPGFVGERTPQEVDWPFVVQRVLSGAGLADGSLWIHQNAERRLYRIDPRP